MRINPIGISLAIIELLVASAGFAKVDPQDVRNGHVWLFEDTKGNRFVEDNSQNNLFGIMYGNANAVIGINGQALDFDGEDDVLFDVGGQI